MKVLDTFAKGRWVQAPKELTLSVLKSLVEVFRRAAAQHAGNGCWTHRGGLCWASLLPPQLDGTSIELKQRTTAKQNDGPFFLSFASRPFTTEAKNKASLILLVSFRSCSRLTLGRIRWRYVVALVCCRNVKKQRNHRNRICPKLYLPRICVRLSLRLFASVVRNSMKAEVIWGRV